MLNDIHTSWLPRANSSMVMDFPTLGRHMSHELLRGYKDFRTIYISMYIL